LAALLALTVGQAVAQASPLPGPRSFQSGLADPNLFESPSASVRSAWLSRARSLRSRWVRIEATWAAIAPSARPRGFDASDPASPGYDWAPLDAELRSASAAGEHVLLLVIAAPWWAEGPNQPSSVHPGSWEPQPQALAAFTRALAKRYSGHFLDPLRRGATLPRVSYFEIWNEPNLAYNISPQWVRGRGRSWIAESPRIFRALLNAAYAAIKSAQPHAFVLAGGTAPYGDPPGLLRMHPVLFWRDLFCLSAALRPVRCGAPPHLDGIDHHPYAYYPYTPTAHAYSPLDASVPDLGRIERVLRAAEHVHTVLPAGPKPLWVTETDWYSGPPARGEPSLATQARYTSLAFYEFWRQGVSHVFWYLLRDYSGDGVFGSAGLYFADGRAKPAAFAFRFPFVALSGHRGVVTLWGRAPRPGIVTIERRMHRRWRIIARLRTTAGGVFYKRARLRARPGLRAVQGSEASVEFTVR
jgi:hypothetical protein